MAWWVEAVSYTFWNGAIWVDVATWLLTSANESWTSHSMRQKAPLSTWWLVRSRSVKSARYVFFPVLGFDVCMLLCRMFDTISMGLSHRRLMTGFRTIHIYGFVWHCSAPWKMGRQGHFPSTPDNSFTNTWYFTYINLKSLNEYEKVKLVIFPV